MFQHADYQAFRIYPDAISPIIAQFDDFPEKLQAAGEGVSFAITDHRERNGLDQLFA